MGSVWKRLNRINKRASRYKFTATYQELYLEAGPTWQPHSLSVVWTRRGRRMVAEPVTWEPTMKSPYIGMCVWPVPDVKEIMVTLYRDQRQEEYDNKDWFFVLEDVKEGKRKPIAQGRLNMRDYAKDIPHEESLKIKLRPLNKKVTSCYLSFTLASQLIKEGKATDDDMKSVASLMSNSTIPNDIAPLEDLLEEQDEEESVTVPSSELAALTASIKSMNDKLENMNPSVLPVRTVLQQRTVHTHHIVQNNTEEQKLDPDPPDLNTLSLIPDTSTRPSQPSFPDKPPAVIDSCHDNTDTDLLLNNDQPQQSIISFQKPPPITPRKIVTAPSNNTATLIDITPNKASGSKTGESGIITPKKVGGTPPKRRHSRNASMSSPFVIPPATPTSKGVAPPQVPPRPPPTNKDTKPLEEVSPPRSAVKCLNPDVSITSSSSQIQQDITNVIQDTNKANGTITVDDTSTANNGVSDKKHKNDVVEDDNNDNVEIRIVDDAKRIEKLQKSKSQELREFTQEFVLSTVIDFDPMTFENTPKSKVSTIKRTGVSVQESPIMASDDYSPKQSKSRNGEDSDNKENDEENKQIHSEPLFRAVKLEFVDEDTTPANNVNNKECSNSSNGHIEDTGTEISSHTKFNSERRGLSNSETSPNLSYLAASHATTQPTTSTPITSSAKSAGTPTTGIGASSDLLDWAKTNLVNYSNVKVTNFTTSWRNGLAFCALIHSFYPDLIQFQDLNPHDIKINNKVAFEAGEILGIPRVLEPESMAIRKIPDKLAVITYLHQLRSSLGTDETNGIYEAFKENGPRHSSGMAIRKSFSEGNIKLFTKQNTFDADKIQPDLATVEEEEGSIVSDTDKTPGVTKNNNVHKYRQKAKDLMVAARNESKDGGEVESSDSSSISVESTPVQVVRRQKSLTPKSKDSRLSYIDNEMLVLDAETQEIDRQAAILDRRLRETSEDDQLVYDALLQQWFTLVNTKNALIRRQMQLNILEKTDDLEKKHQLLKDELRLYSDMSDTKKTDDDRQREELLLQELVVVVNQRNELVMQGDYEQQMIEINHQIEQDVTLPEDRLVHNNKKDECKMQ